jgi:PTS system ascorbate-specific IIA component
MIGIVIIAHGTLGETLIECATHVLGARPARVASLSVGVRKDPDVLLSQARDLVRDVDDGSGVLILTDMVGGTPSNVATRALIADHVNGVSGASLPMLVRALTYREKDLAAVTQKALSGGQQGVGQLITEGKHDGQR